jgi:hypothetical protein
MKAFPEIKYVAPQGMGSHVMAIEGGMTLRDYFAAAALVNLVHLNHQNDIAHAAYAIADALMKERVK